MIAETYENTYQTSSVTYACLISLLRKCLYQDTDYCMGTLHLGGSSTGGSHGYMVMCLSLGTKVAYNMVTTYAFIKGFYVVVYCMSVTVTRDREIQT